MYTAEYTINKKNKKLVKEKLLTIGIITKNECEKLERCLKSLMPLKEAIDCEIIVTDTGSTDNTVEMAKNYADQILHFEWCNDFAAARNTGIDAAKGLWFMWIDSDEWLENPEYIIKFFKEDQYKKYASATVDFIDYKDNEKKIYSHTTMLRLTVVYNGIRFNGRIHEAMVTAIPFKSLMSKLYHDGYAFEDIEKKNKKNLRNIELLMERYNEDPDRLSSIRYLVDQYRFMNNYELANDFCEKGILLTEQSIEEIKKSYNLHFKIMMSSNYINQDKYEEALDVIDKIEYFEKNDEYRRLDIYYLKFCAYLKLEDEENLSKTSEMYVNHYLKQDEFPKDNAYIFFLISNQKNVVNIVLLKAIEKMINVDTSDDEIIRIIKRVLEKIKDIDGLSYDVEYINFIMNVVFKFKKYSFIEKLYSDINSRYINISKIQFEKYLKKYLMENESDTIDFVAEVSKIKENTDFIKFIKYLNSYFEDDEFTAKFLLKEIIESYKEILDNNIKSEIIFGLLKYNIDFDEISKKIDIFNDSNFGKSFILEHSNFFECALEYYEKNENKILLDMRLSYFFLAIFENFAFEYNEVIEDIFYKLVELAPMLFSKLYNLEHINEKNIDMLPPVFRFTFYIERANQYKKEDNLLEYIVELKNAFQSYPIMKKPILKIIDSIEERMAEKLDRETELKNLAQGVKRKIYELISKQLYEDALSVISQLQSIIPNDLELKELKSKIILEKI